MSVESEVTRIRGPQVSTQHLNRSVPGGLELKNPLVEGAGSMTEAFEACTFGEPVERRSGGA